MKSIPYASTVGSLLYLQVCTKPDIAMAIGMLGRYQSNPGMKHWKVAKKVMQYLQGTKESQFDIQTHWPFGGGWIFKFRFCWMCR
jgi:hypothetical protein